MNAYGGHEPSLFSFGFSDPTMYESFSRFNDPMISSSFYTTEFDDDLDDEPLNLKKKTNCSPPKHRHDGTSPLPLGMDWSPPPRTWDGRDSVWPHDPHTGWSYCVTVPCWTILPGSRGSDTVVFFRVQVGIQTPEGITTTQGILRRFNDFLKLFSELQKAFTRKILPPAPPRRILRIRNKSLLEERRCALEDWMERLLSDIDLSRSAPVAVFLELEAAVRSSFHDSDQIVFNGISDSNSVLPSYQFPTNSDASLGVVSSSIASDFGNNSVHETSELGTPRLGASNKLQVDISDSASNKDLTCDLQTTVAESLSVKVDSHIMKDYIQDCQVKFPREKIPFRRENSAMVNDDIYSSTSAAVSHCEDMKELSSGLKSCKLDNHVRTLANENVESDMGSVRVEESSNLGVAISLGDNSLGVHEGAEASRSMNLLAGSDLHFPNDFLVALPSDERHKVNRVLITMHRRLTTAKSDVEDLIARLNQELSVREYLTAKVKDLEVEVETTKQSGKENLQQAILIERGSFTQMQWDVEDLRRKCMELELKLKIEQDEKMQMETSKVSIIQQNKLLLQELDASRLQLDNLQKHREELELKSKSEVKLLVKEVKSLRGSHLELKHEASRLMKEKLETERALHQEKQRWERANAANVKLLRECEVLRNRLEECGVNFHIEEEDKFTMGAPSHSDAVDLLITSDSRIGLLIAEAQLLSQDVKNDIAAADHSSNGVRARTTEDELRLMLTDVFIDNAKLRKQVNSAIRCALNVTGKSFKNEVDE